MRRWALLCAAAIGLASDVGLSEEPQNATARYRIELQLDWSAERHPHDFPANPHFSRLIGATHDERYTLFADGATGSSGLALVATNGRTSVLEAELGEATRRRRVGSVMIGAGLASGVGRLDVEFEASLDHSRVSVVSMLAPSPDWFTGVAALELAPGGEWIEQAEQPLWVWDAGADSGAAYSARNAETQPRQSVRLAAGPQFLRPSGLTTVGRAVIRRLN